MTLRAPAWPRRPAGLPPTPTLTGMALAIGAYLAVAGPGAVALFASAKRLLPTAPTPVQFFGSALAGELLLGGALLALVAVAGWWPHAALATTRAQLRAATHAQLRAVTHARLRAALATVFGWLAVLVMGTQIVAVIVHLASGPSGHASVDQTPLPVLVGLVAIAMALVAFVEELLFRGLLLSALLARWGQGRRGIYQATITSSVIFGACHLISRAPLGMAVVQVSVAAVMGLVWAAVRLRSGSIWVGVVLHWLLNTAAILALLGLARGPSTTRPSWTLLVVLVLFTLLGLSMIESHCKALQPNHDQQPRAATST
jgi:membrane protease YdiL (CAAX protease family)